MCLCGSSSLPWNLVFCSLSPLQSQDNSGCVASAHNMHLLGRSKQVVPRVCFVQKLIQDGIISTQQCPAAVQIPDIGTNNLTCKRGSVGQSEGLSIPRSSVRFRLKPDTSNSREFELHRPSNKGTKLLLKVIKVIIIISFHKSGLFVISFSGSLRVLFTFTVFFW